MKLESDGMAFSEEIKIEALRNPRIRFGEISIMYSARARRNQTEPVARRRPESLVPGQEALLPMSISAVVPVWNGRELLARLLDTLDAQTLRAAEVIVVDNGSSDGAPELARAARRARDRDGAECRLRGRRESRHRGGRASDWIAVLNTDVELAPDYLREARCRSGAWFATGKILRCPAQRPRRWHLRPDLPRRRPPGAPAADAPMGRFSRKPRRIFSAPWTAALFRAEVFRKVGLLDESFESYLEDVDFGLRCAARDISGLYVPEAVAWHQGSASLGRWHPETVRRIARNQLLLAARHLSGGIVVARSWWRRYSGAASRCGTALHRLAARRRQGLRASRQRAPDIARHLLQDCCEYLRENERDDLPAPIGNLVRHLLEAVLAVHRGGAK